MPIDKSPNLSDIVSSSIEKEVIPVSASLEFCGDHLGRFNGDVLSTVKQETGVSYRDHFWLGMSAGFY